MNASVRTRNAARGVMLLAAYLDQSPHRMDSPAALAWLAFRDENSPKMIEIVEQAQRDLFDTINNAF